MPRSRKQNEEIKKVMINKIREAGLKLFSQKGLVATSIIDIAEKAGISVGLLYHYYRSKEDLYSELIGIAINESTEAVKIINSMETTPMEKINIFTERILNETSNHDRTFRFFLLVTQALLGTDLPEKAKGHLQNAYESLNIMESIILDGQIRNEIKEGNTNMLTTLFLASINGICTYKLMMGEHFTLPETSMITILLSKK